MSKLMKLLTPINLSKIVVISVTILSVSHLFVTNSVEMLERKLKRENKDLRSVNEWKRRNFLSQLVYFPKD